MAELFGKPLAYTVDNSLPVEERIHSIVEQVCLAAREAFMHATNELAAEWQSIAAERARISEIARESEAMVNEVDNRIANAEKKAREVGLGALKREREARVRIRELELSLRHAEEDHKKELRRVKAQMTRAIKRPSHRPAQREPAAIPVRRSAIATHLL